MSKRSDIKLLTGRNKNKIYSNYCSLKNKMYTDYNELGQSNIINIFLLFYS